LSDADIEIVPTTESNAVESNIHPVSANRIIDDLAPPASNARVSGYAKAPTERVAVPSSNRRDRVSASDFLTKPRMALPEPLRVGVSSRPPQSVAPAVDRPRRSAKRSFFAKFLFLMILTAALTLVAMEISIARDLPWLDPRPLLVKLWNLVARTIPWENLPKLPKL